MSGVAGADRVKSRQDFQQFLKSYKDLVSQFPGFVGFNPSGSYNSDMSKNDFGDIDIIVHIKSDKDKATVKKELQAFLQRQPETVIVPFSSEKHAGKRSYNAGELVSVRYHDDSLGYSAQIDNIVALDQTEATFKQLFLDWPAEKQGLILGLVKIATIETDPAVLFKKLGINAQPNIEQNQEYEFNLSSVELQLRLVTYDPELLAQGQYKQLSRDVVWNTRNFEDIQKLLYQYNLDANFDQLLAQSKQVIKNPRSNSRMQGVFSSMITVKSGEVGTAKAAGKEAALDKIKQTFGESRGLLRALIETSAPSTVVFAFGRLQPPTIGHELLVNAVKQTAEQNHCPYVIYVSRTVGKTPAEKLKNPLTVDQKMGYLSRMFPGTNFQPATDAVRTPVEAARYLNQKYRNIIMIAGGSRAEEFEKLLNDYNGKDYNFDSIKVVKIDRDPDADDASGISGTKMRQAAAADDFETFKSGVPGSLDDATAQQLMADVKAGMTPTPKVKKTKEDVLPTNQTPLQNIPQLDDEEGIQQAQQAGIKIKSPKVADAGPVETDVIQAIKLLQQTLANKFGVVTSMNDKFHQRQPGRSDHKLGKGMDFTTVPAPKNQQEAAIIKNKINALLKQAGLPVRYVGDEYFADKAPNATGGHYHVSMSEAKSPVMANTAQRLADNVNDNLSELMNTKPAKSNQAKWRGDDNLANLNFVASNGIPYQLSIMGFHAAPDEVQPYDFDTFDNADGDPDLGRFIEFIQETKPGVGYGKQGIEGTGAAAEVFGIVYNAIAQYVKKHKLTFVMFQAAEPSRRKLYTALIRKMLQTFPGWKYEEQDGVYFVYNSKYFQQQKSDDDADIAEIFGLKTKPEAPKPKRLTPDDYAELMKMSKQQKPIGPTANKKVYHGPDEYDWEKKHGLAEANSLEGTVKTIADHGKYIAQVFEQLKAMAKRYVDSRGDLKGFAMVAGGVGSRWFNDFYFNKLQAELYALTKQAPKHSQALIYFLKDASEDREHKISFNEISKQLPTILFNMGHKMKSGALTQFADNWGNRYHEYKNYLSKIEIEAGYDADDFDEPKVKAPKSDTMGKQNVQVDQIVSGVLAKLPKKIAGDIRNAIARSDNKLQALHQELKKRDIQGVAEGSLEEVNRRGFLKGMGAAAVAGAAGAGAYMNRGTSNFEGNGGVYVDQLLNLYAAKKFNNEQDEIFKICQQLIGEYLQQNPKMRDIVNSEYRFTVKQQTPQDRIEVVKNARTIIQDFKEFLKGGDPLPRHLKDLNGGDEFKESVEQGVAEGVPQPGESSGAPKKFGPNAKIEPRQMTVKQIISSIPGVPYYNNVVDDWDAKDYSWGVTKKVIEYATYLKDHPESLSHLPPILVLNGKFEDGAHRVSAIWLLQQRMDPKNPLWANAKLNVQFVKQGVAEADMNRRGFLKGMGAAAVAGAAGGAKADRSWGQDEFTSKWKSTMNAENFNGAYLNVDQNRKLFRISLVTPINFTPANIQRGNLYYPKITSSKVGYKWGGYPGAYGQGKVGTSPAKQFGNYVYYYIDLFGDMSEKLFNDIWNVYLDSRNDKFIFQIEIDNEPTTLVFKVQESDLQQLRQQQPKESVNQGVAEAFDQPYKGKWEKIDDYSDSVDMSVKLPDGTNLSIMFNQDYGDEGEEVIQVEFYRNNRQDVTGGGDAQRIFATVLDAIQKYIKKYKPQKLSFSASKAVDMDTDDNGAQVNPESRAKLYDRLVQRYSKALGYRAFRADNGDIVIYELSRIKQGVAEGWKDWAVGGAMALGALGAGHAQAADLSNYNTQYLQQVVSGEHPRPMVSIDDAKAELQARANGKQQSVPTPAKLEKPKGFSKEYLQSVIDGTHPRPLISKERAQELLQQQTTNEQGVAKGPTDNFNNIGENWELAKAEAIARLIESQLK